jgi:hypothetical protein
MAGRTWMDAYPKRSIADVIGYCEFAMEEEDGERRPDGLGCSWRFLMARGMRVVLERIRWKQELRGVKDV